MAIEDVTRGDLEQMFENTTQTILKEMDRRFVEVDEELAKATDERAEIRTTLDRLTDSTNEDIVTLYQEVGELKKKIEVLEKTAA